MFLPTPKKIVQDVYCRVQPSPAHGVGVFAIRRIEKGTYPLLSPHAVIGSLVADIDYPILKVADARLLKEAPNRHVKRMLKDLTWHEDKFHVPFFGYNWLPMDYYVNTHLPPDTPNVEWVMNLMTFVAVRDIPVGTELFSTYRILR